MNKTDFSIINGFPLNQASLDRLQTAFSLFNAFGSIVGDKSIISGCTVNGSSVTNGTVFIAGELFEFRGGLTQTKVIVKEDVTNLIYKNGNHYPAVKTRYVTFGAGVGAMDWADFKRGFETKGIAALVTRIAALEARPIVGNIPVGLIALWDRPANEIPAGWQEHLPMTGKMAVGFDGTDASFDVVGKTGGAKSKTLTIDEMPEHGHAYSRYKLDQEVSTSGDGVRALNKNNILEPFQTDLKGSGQEFSIMNPYRVVHYIKYVG